MSADRSVQITQPVIVPKKKPTVHGLSGLSNEKYEYTICTYKQAIQLELSGVSVNADVNCGWTCLTQFDLKTASIIGSRKYINVFIEGNTNLLDTYAAYNIDRSGIYCFPSSLKSVLMATFGMQVTFLTGRSVNSVMSAEDMIDRVAYKILKRTIVMSKVKAVLYKIVSRVAPMMLSAVALSM